MPPAKQPRGSGEHAAYHRIALDMAAGNSQAGPIRLKIISDSMRPFLLPGDVVVVSPLEAGKTLQRGDIIVLQRKDSVDAEIPLTHRMIARSAAGWVTKGDNRLFPDSPGEPDDLLGKVIAYQRGQKQVDLNTPGWRLVNSVLGWFHFGVGSLMASARRIRRILYQHQSG